MSQYAKSLYSYDDKIVELALNTTNLTKAERDRVAAIMAEVRAGKVLLNDKKAEIQQLLIEQHLTDKEITDTMAKIFYTTVAPEGVEMANTETARSILISKGVSAAKADEIISRNTNAKAATNEASSLQLAGTAAKNMLSSVWGFVTAHPVISALVVAVGALSFAFNKAEKDIQNASDAVTEATENWENLKNSLHNNQQTVASISKEFQTLGTGVSSSGENISLTTDEFERYNSIANQIADMFPEMVVGYTNQGNAILSCKGNVEALNDALREQQELYHYTILNDADTVFDKWQGTWFSNNFRPGETITGQIEQLEYYKSVLDAVESADPEAINKVFRSAIHDKNEPIDSEMYGGKHGRALLEEALGDQFASLLGRGNMDELSGDDKKYIRAQIKAIVSEYDAQLSAEEQTMQQLLTSHLALNDAFTEMTPEVRAAVQNMVNGLDYSFFQSFVANGQRQSAMYAWIDSNIIDPLQDPSTRNSFVEALNFFTTRNISPQSLNTALFDDYGRAIEKLKTAFSGDEINLEELMRDDDVKAFIITLQKCGLAGDDAKTAIEAVGNSLAEASDNAADAAGNFTDAATALTSLAGDIETMAGKYDLLKDAQEEVATSGTLSLNTINAIAEKYPEMADDVLLYISGLKTGEELLLGLSDAYETDRANYYESIKGKLIATEDFYNSLTDDQKTLVDDLRDSYGVDFDNFVSVETEKARIHAEVIAELARQYSEYANYTLEDLEARVSLVRGKMSGAMDESWESEASTISKAEYDAMVAAINRMKEANAKLEEFKVTLDGIKTDGWDPSKYSSSAKDAASAAKDAAEKAEDAFKKLKEQLEDWFSDMEFQVEIKFNAGDIEGASELYQQMIDKARESLDDAFDMGLTIDDDWVQNLMGKINDYKKSLADLRLGELDKFIEIHDSFDGWDDLDLSKLDTLKKKLSEINKLYEEGLLNYQDYYDLYMDTAGDIYDIQRDALDELLKTTMDALEEQNDAQIEMIEEQRDAQVEALEDQADALDRIIEKKKKLLEDTRDEADYEEKVADYVARIAELQERISQLKLDDSREAAAERAALEEELATLQKEQTDYMADYATDKTLAALDEQNEAHQDSIDEQIEAIEDAADAEIKILKDAIDTEYELRKKAIDLINRDYRNMMEDVEGYFAQLGITLDEELIQRLRDGLDLVAQYGDYTSAGTGITNSATSGMLPAKSVSKIVGQMKENAAAWHAASPGDERRNLEKANENLAQQLRDMGLNVWKDSARGVWLIKLDGKTQELFKAYSVFHEGGVAGLTRTPKSDEIFALLKKGEVILNDGQQKNLLNILNNAASWVQSQMAASFGAIAGNMRNMKPAVATSGLTSYSPNIEIHFEGVGNMDESKAKKLGEVAADSALEKLWTTLQKRGIT